MKPPGAISDKTEPELQRLVVQIVRTTPLPRLLELYYWTQEPGMVACVRWLAALPPDILGAIRLFIDAAAGDSSLTARFQDGRLELQASQAKDALAMVDYMLRDDADGGAPATNNLRYSCAADKAWLRRGR
jgi:hypothetical protein